MLPISRNEAHNEETTVRLRLRHHPLALLAHSQVQYLPYRYTNVSMEGSGYFHCDFSSCCRFKPYFRHHKMISWVWFHGADRGSNIKSSNKATAGLSSGKTQYTIAWSWPRVSWDLWQAAGYFWFTFTLSVCLLLLLSSFHIMSAPTATCSWLGFY